MLTAVPVSDSRVQHIFFKFIQDENDSAKILGRLNSYRCDGKTLSWFQDVIPELIPGEQGQQPWLKAAREMLWTPETHQDHERLLENASELKSDAPSELQIHDFGLRRLWPVVVEFLQPMSPRMVAAVNQVSIVLARTDCLLSEDSQAYDSLPLREGVTLSFDFIVKRQAVQDKILSPLIEEVDQNRTRVTTPAFGLQIQDNAAITEQNIDTLQQNGRYDCDFRHALSNLRDVIVGEKDIYDDAQINRKRTHQETLPEEDGNNSTHRKVRRKNGFTPKGTLHAVTEEGE
jgi:hypothetical protein